MKRARVWIWLLAAVLLSTPLEAAQSSYSWDSSHSVGPDMVFFGEAPDPDRSAPEKPEPSDKSYPWYFLDKGNKHVLAGEWEKAAIAYREAYSVSGPTRVLCGFKLVETLQKMGRVEAALEMLDDLEKKYLVGPREFAEARRLRTALLDEKRNRPEKKMPPFTGREWVLQVSAWRVKFVLEGMDRLRAAGVPLKESYQEYVFFLDERFLAHPELPASDPAEALAAFIYERDIDARIPIDRWKASSELGVRSSEKVAGQPQTSNPLLRTPNAQLRTKFTGAEWITMVHNEKMEYVGEAMAILQNQHVPMKRSHYGYVDALDVFFTEHPELPASDSVAALASLLYGSEPQAREVLDALRLL